ncbi:MAG TPA: DUF4919 domain-containing protein [Burkholderiaceae bacterium]
MALGPLQHARAADEALVKQFLATRQALVEQIKIDVPAMSRDIRSAVQEAERIQAGGQWQQAIDRLRQLEKYMPLADLPSYDVQMLLSFLYMKTADTPRADAHHARASAMRSLLAGLGAGATPDAPVSVLMTNEMIEWHRSQMRRTTGVKNLPHNGREILAVSSVFDLGGGGNGPEQVAYFEFDPKIRARERAQTSLFVALPVERLTGKYGIAFEQAKQKRARLLADTSFEYLALFQQLADLSKKAKALDSAGKPQEALATLKELEATRPFEETPVAGFLELASYLSGKNGETERQMRLRELIFGVQQAIAHSGDALSPETAVHVVGTSEEYEWLRDKKLTFVSQRVHQVAPRIFDAMTARDATGNQREYYFDITPIYARYMESFKSGKK